MKNNRPKWQIYLSEQLEKNDWISDIDDEGVNHLTKQFSYINTESNKTEYYTKSTTLRTTVISKDLFEAILVDQCKFSKDKVNEVIKQFEGIVY